MRVNLKSWAQPRVGQLVAAGVVSLSLGCGGGVAPPALNPSDAAAQAIAEYDSDGSGSLSQEEVAKCPAIAELFAQYDADGSGEVSPDEIKGRFEQLKGAGVGLTSFVCDVSKGGRPLSNVTVRMTPEPFMGGALPAASGVTDGSGRAEMSVEPEALPKDWGGAGAVAPGIYRIEIDHPEAAASGDLFGAEVNPIRRGGDRASINL
ncbi:EF hand [Posidoniimonas polymericola]|uniref:EF hand n=1 Tax=Posidoniimonas polymericola TaxID=2528002 RepID=A0A5C5YD14_9BACT|nr:EF-hand domain-containing protein [Posidoniimonas polymericola]TWT72838.1 EF hand [Posidoniimonas polymericola]